MGLVSIIVPNLNSPILNQTLDSLLTQTYEGSYEIIVVGQDKFDNKTKYPGVKFIETKEPLNPAQARNLGVRSSSGSFLVFIDSDCIADKDWLTILLRTLLEDEKRIVGSGVTSLKNNYWTLSDNIASFHDYMTWTSAGERDQLPSIGLAIRRIDFISVGMFNEKYKYPAGEDSELTTKLKLSGYKLMFQPQAVLLHNPQRSNFFQVLRHAFFYGSNSIKVNPAYQSVLRIPFILRSWILTIIFSPILSLYVVLKIVFFQNLPLEMWKTLPVVFLAKIAWCFGASSTLRKRKL